MTKFFKIPFTTLLLLLVVSSIVSCKKKFDEPPAYVDPNMVANTSIAQLKALHTTFGALDLITSDIIISGVVTADDKSGNLYKSIFIQDSTAALQISLDASSLYTQFPQGRRVYIKCKGLYISDYKGTPQLGIVNHAATVPLNPTVTGIPSSLINNYVIGGSFNNPVVATPVTPNQLSTGLNNNRLMGMLVQLSNVEIDPAYANIPYGDTTASKNSNAIQINICNGTSSVYSNVELYSSGYADFAAYHPGTGNGTITGIYTVYKSTATSSGYKQLLIRDTNDVVLTGTRCAGQAPPPPPPGNRISIAALRAMYTGSGSGTGNLITGAYQIGGVVISDGINGKNIGAGNVIIQDGHSGISIFFGGTLTYNVGDSLVLNVQGDSLLNYKGSLEVKVMGGGSAPSPTATGQVITPTTMTIAQLNTALATPLSSASNVEYTLVKIVGGTVTTSGTYSGAKTLGDGTATMTLYTRPTAAFSGSTMPTGAHNWTGYANTFNTPELQIRNTTDVQ